jgi:hypothetical protein
MHGIMIYDDVFMICLMEDFMIDVLVRICA